MLPSPISTAINNEKRTHGSFRMRALAGNRPEPAANHRPAATAFQIPSTFYRLINTFAVTQVKRKATETVKLFRSGRHRLHHNYKNKWEEMCGIISWNACDRIQCRLTHGRFRPIDGWGHKMRFTLSLNLPS